MNLHDKQSLPCAIGYKQNPTSRIPLKADKICVSLLIFLNNRVLRQEIPNVVS